MADALDWLQRNDSAVGYMDDASVVSEYSRMSKVPGISPNFFNADKRARQCPVLRSNGVQPGDLDDASLHHFEPLAVVNCTK
jgi:hypothetical protein